MKIAMVGVVCAAVLVAGCASKETQLAYMDRMAARDAAVVASIDKQTAGNRVAHTSMMNGYTAAMLAATRTSDKSDDVILAFAWGVAVGTPVRVVTPTFATIQPPPTNLDYLKASIPLVGLAMPLIYPLAYGWGDNNDGYENNYVVTDQGRVNVASQNPGSLNKTGGDVITTTNPDNKSSWLQGGGVQGEQRGVGIEGEVNPVQCGGAQTPVYGDGQWWANSVGGCSCDSRAQGSC